MYSLRHVILQGEAPVHMIGIQVWTKNSDSSLCADVLLITEISTVSRYKKPRYTPRNTGEERQ